MMGSAVIRDSSTAVARGRGHSLPTPETNDALSCDSWLIVSLREYNAAGLTEYEHALIMRNVSPPFFQRWNYTAIFREYTRNEYM